MFTNPCSSDYFLLNQFTLWELHWNCYYKIQQSHIQCYIKWPFYWPINILRQIWSLCPLWYILFPWLQRLNPCLHFSSYLITNHLLHFLFFYSAFPFSFLQSLNGNVLQGSVLRPVLFPLTCKAWWFHPEHWL